MSYFDLLLADNVARLLRDILAGCYFYIHFGIPCSSFSVIQNLNQGTRSIENPSGDGSLERELVGNKFADTVSMLCNALQEVGAFYSLENPRSSYLWRYSPISKLLDHAVDVDFDQCAYGLAPPGVICKKSDSCSRIKKPTRVRTNLLQLQHLARKWSCAHKHFTCLGSVKVDGSWVSVAKEAGKYPLKLCDEWASLVSLAVSETRP